MLVLPSKSLLTHKWLKYLVNFCLFFPVKYLFGDIYGIFLYQIWQDDLL